MPKSSLSKAILTSSLPKGWKLTRFGDLVQIGEGLVQPTESPYIDQLHIGPDNMRSGEEGVMSPKTARELALKSGKYAFDSNAILYSKIRPNLNKLCCPGFAGICSADVYPLWPNGGLVDKSYLAQVMRHPVFVEQAVAVSARSGFPKINRPDLFRIRIPLPPLSEQSAIVNFLSTWDRAIEQTQKLIDAKLRLKRGLMQQLLTGKLRFEEFRRSSWKEYRIGDLLEEVKRPITFDDSERYDLISVRRRSGGLFHRGALHGHQIETKNLSIAKAGDFLISRMQVVHGASGLTTPEFDGMKISGSYTALVTKDPNVIRIEFFDLLSRTPQLYRLAYLASWGVHIEKMTFSLPLYLKSKIRIPSDVAEQDKIVGIIRAASDEIKKLEESQRLFKVQKRGLMQVLLTGKVRVKVDSAEVQNA